MESISVANVDSNGHPPGTYYFSVDPITPNAAVSLTTASPFSEVSVTFAQAPPSGVQNLYMSNGQGSWYWVTNFYIP